MGRIVISNEPEEEILKAILSIEGHDVEVIEDEGEIIELIDKREVDLLILGGPFFNYDGYKLCERVRGKLVPILLLAHPEDRIRAIECGGDGIIEKPLRRVEVLAHTRTLLKVKKMEEELLLLDKAIESLASAIEAKDPYTEGHTLRVANYMVKLSEAMGMKEEDIRRGGILHDVGKIGVRDEILTKKGPLNSWEWERIKEHPIIGERIVKPLGSRIIESIVRHHHERYDGKGYPDGLKGEEIPIYGRMMSVVDAFDAMISERPYRKALSREEAMEVLKKERGKQFDPEIASIFLDILSHEN